MGVETALLAVAAVSAYGAYEQRQDAKEARKQAERQAALDREAIAALKAEPTPAMPTSADARRARRTSIAEQMRRRGRASTILTDSTESSDVLGT